MAFFNHLNNMKTDAPRTIFAALVCFFLLGLGTATAQAVPSELDRYLALPDDSFRWEIVEKIDERCFLLEITSQTWHDIPWKHYMLLALPQKTAFPDSAVLYIGGRRIGSKPGDGDRFLSATLAELCGMAVGMLFQVPNQPLFGDYVEDALIGETLLKALQTEDTTWPLLFPMTKSAIRGMDVVQQCLRREKDLEIKRFVVTGVSKRGWTTWLTGASNDPRVLAIAPVVIDTLNMRRQMQYQIETWGEFSPSIGDYTARNLVRKDETDLPAFKEHLWTIVDPYSYRSRLTMPKLLVHGTNDPYWTVDSTRHYWDGLTGPKYILTLPNAGHDLGGRQIDATRTIAAFARHAAAGDAWPRLDWELEEDDKSYRVRIRTDLSDVRVRLWSAASESRDFRKARWSSREIGDDPGAAITIPKPESGHIAFYVELASPKATPPFSLTTQVWRF